MANFWPNEFEETSDPSAKEILEEQAEVLPRLTDGKVTAEVVSLDEMDRITDYLHTDFAYRFDIVGRYLHGYRFKVFSFGHDITLFPVRFKIDEQLVSELALSLNPAGQLSVSSPDELEVLFKQVFQSKRMRAVIGSILKLSK